ncbi:MAG: HlyD family efflux transporter periplasmic adaptor subunit [Synechococcaceae cyanobacterium]|nr:HlyD family efflux transporter periplasmic adaptor subunit [Synechococcaceae cyanobacterium]
MARRRGPLSGLRSLIDFLAAPLRGAPGRSLQPHLHTEKVRVDVLDDPHSDPDPSARPRPAQPSAGGALTPTATPTAPPPEEWQFRQSVLLRKSGLSSSTLVWAAVLFTGGAVVWALVAPLGESIAVVGKLEPGSSVKRIDTPVPGIVEAVLVREGERVRQGQPLVRFDLREARSALLSAEAVRNRLLSENAMHRSSLGESDPTVLSANQRLQLDSQQRDILSRRQAALADLAKSQARLQGLQATLTTARDVARRYGDLASTGAVSEVQVLESVNKVQQLEAERNAEQREQARLQAVLSNTEANPGVDLRPKIEANLQRISELDRDITQARLRLQYGVLKAPAAGEVFDITVGPGSVVQIAQTDVSKPVMKIVPLDSLQAKVYLPNTAIGFVRLGQRADISLDTFNASDYGRVQATVKRIGSDALTPDELTQALGANASGLYFPAILRLSRQSINLGQRSVPLQAGMSLTADIQLRQRRFINLLTSFFEDKRLNLERLR